MILALSLGDKVVNHLASRWIAGESVMIGVTVASTYHFALARKQNKVSGKYISFTLLPMQRRINALDRHLRHRRMAMGRGVHKEACRKAVMAFCSVHFA